MLNTVVKSLLSVVCIAGIENFGFGQQVTQILDASGDGSHALSAPTVLAVDLEGNLFVAGRNSNNLFMVTPGDSVTEILDQTGDGFGNTFERPLYGLATDAEGNVYVTGRDSQNAFKIEDPGSTNLVVEIINRGGDSMNSQEYLRPAGIAVDQSGFVYTACSLTGRMFQIEPSMFAIAEICDYFGGNPYVTAPRGVATDVSGIPYVCGYGDDSVYSLGGACPPPAIIGSSGDGTQPLDGPGSVITDNSDRVYVAGYLSNNVFRVTDPGGTNDIELIIDGTGDGINALVGPSAMALDSSGNLYVAGEVSDNVFKVTPSGVITLVIDGMGDGLGNTLDQPQGIAVDGSGNVYVSGRASNNVFKVAPCPVSVKGTSFSYNGSLINQDVLAANAIVIGSSWSVVMTPQPTRAAGAWLLYVCSASTAGPTLDLGLLLGLPSAGNSELLVNLSAPITTLVPPAHGGGASSTPFEVPVPGSCSLVGNSFFAQAIVLGDLPTGSGMLDPWFSTAVAGVIGTH